MIVQTSLKWACMVACALGASACSSMYEPVPHATPVQDESVVSRTSAMAHTYILDRNTNFVTCAEPMPDSSFSSGQADSFSLFQFGGTDGAAESSKAAENGLEGRTPTVLMTRELFFRLCEFSRNYQLSKDEAKELYLKTLNTIAPVWNVEAGNTKVSISETQTISESETTANSNTPSQSSSENSASTGTTTDTTSTSSDSSSSSDY